MTQRWKRSVQGERPGPVIDRINRLSWLARTYADTVLIEEACVSYKSTQALERCKPGDIYSQLVAIQQATTDEGQRLRIGWAIRRAQARLMAQARAA